jgi:BirA family biotin operon repressor/biotin-[acetyl-CoA-carboxylase] ligase
VVPLIVGEEIWYFPTLDRGMEKAKELITLYPRTANGRILWMGEVLQAKGRFQRRWFAEKGGLWLVLTLYDELLGKNRGLLSLVVGLALVKTARTLGASEVYLKWINDLHFKGKKLAGVLMETWEEWFIIGIGMNVNNTPPGFLPAISLREILCKEVPLEEVLSKFLKYFNSYYKMLWNFDLESLYEEKLINPIIEKFKKYTDTLGKWVYYHYNVEEKGGLIAKAVDLDQKGALILEREGSIIKVSSGEISYLA